MKSLWGIIAGILVIGLVGINLGAKGCFGDANKVQITVGSSAPEPSLKATAIAAGGGHTVALLPDKTIRAWGDNWYGQLGDGTWEGERHTPITVSGIATATAIAAGWYYTVALLQDGTIQAWGRNDYGQLGDGTVITRTTPVPVSGISTATAIAAGVYHTIVLLQDGTIQGWGFNDYGQLGNGTTVISSTTPVPVLGITTATAIACGYYHTVAFMQDGTIQTWGNNYDGQLGNGTVISSTTPVPVLGITTATAIAAGGYHTIALLQDGTIQAWGGNGYGQLGDNQTSGIYSTIPVQVWDITTATAIAAEWLHTVTLMQDGTIQAWGDNWYGQLGDGTAGTNRTTPVPVSGINTATAIAAGSNHTIALLLNGSIRTWGDNWYGQLGIGSADFDPHPIPLRVSGF